MANWRVEPDDAAVEAYIARLALPIRLIARDLDALVRAELPEARAGIKWSVPFYAQKGPICYVSAAKRHVTFGLVNGVDIPDASGRLVGTDRSPIRKAVFPTGEAVPKTLIRGWLRHARRIDARWGEG